jgi:hypothetical protein
MRYLEHLQACQYNQFGGVIWVSVKLEKNGWVQQEL